MSHYSAILVAYFRQHDRGWVLALLAAVCLVYMPFLGSRFVFDDYNFFTGVVAQSYADAPFNLSLRWLPYASLGWTYAVFNDVDTYAYHLGNALLHAANVILLFYLLRQMVGAVIPQSTETSAVVWGAWMGALVFAAHPVAVYAVGYVIQRSILLATFFCLLMSWAYLRGMLGGQIRWLVLSVVAYFWAVFSKEHSVMMPAVLLAMTLLLRMQISVDRRALWLSWLAFAGVALLVILRAKGVFGAAYEPMAAALFDQQRLVESTPMLHLLSVMTQAGLFFKYLFLWLLPNPAWMSVDMREQFIPVWTAWQGWLGVSAFLAYGALALRLLLRGGRKGLFGFALLYPWLLFLIEFSSIRVQEPFVLYRSYLWMPGLMLVFPLLLLGFPGRKTLMALAIVVLVMTSFAWNRLWVFADNYRLWHDAALLLPNEQVPGADRIFYNRAQAEAAAQKWEEAVADYQRTVALSPQLAPVRYALGIAYLNLARYQEGIEQLDVAITLLPDDARLYFAKGMALKAMQKDEQAMQQIVKSCELKNVTACLIVGMAPRKK